MVHQFGAMAFVVALGAATIPPGSAAPASPPAAVPHAPAPAAPPPAVSKSSSAATPFVPAPAPVVSQDAAARTRMHECGHQWSALKKAGNVGTLTWKEFSATCLVVSK